MEGYGSMRGNQQNVVADFMLTGGGESHMTDFEPGHLCTDVRVGKVELSLGKLSLSRYLVFILVKLLDAYYVLAKGIQR